MVAAEEEEEKVGGGSGGGGEGGGAGRWFSPGILVSSINVTDIFFLYLHF